MSIAQRRSSIFAVVVAVAVDLLDFARSRASINPPLRHPALRDRATAVDLVDDDFTLETLDGDPAAVQS